MTDKAFDNTLLKKIRKALALSQTQFAEELGTRQQIIAMVENNKRGVPKSIISGLLSIYGISYDDNLKVAYRDGKIFPFKESPKKYKATITLDICSSDETSAMTCVLNAMSKTGKCLVNKIEIL